jgi:hypothetical protein
LCINENFDVVVNLGKNVKIAAGRGEPVRKEAVAVEKGMH